MGDVSDFMAFFGSERWSRNHLKNTLEVAIAPAETAAKLTTWHQGLLDPEKLALPETVKMGT